MAAGRFHPLFSGTAITSAGTLVSRVLGLVRDTATAALFGLAAGGVLDALVVAFRIPNLFRALFGEGALTASYLPVFSDAWERDRSAAWRIFRSVNSWLAKALFGITVAAEAGIGIWVWLARGDSHALLLAGLSAVLLPYLILVCLAAVTSATLQGLGRFSAPALAPAVLNSFWILGAVIVAPRIASDAVGQAYILAVCVLLGGLAQWAVQWPSLREEGFQLNIHSSLVTGHLQRTNDKGQGTLPELARIRRGMIPTTLALTVTQLNTLADSLVAWILAAPRGSSRIIPWLGVEYPMEQGAAAALYFGERLYQFPLGLIGIAVATVVFPLLARHTARGDLAAVGEDLTRGLRLVFLVAVPSAVGLVVLAEPIARLMFEHGQFTAADTARTARIIAVYGSGVWAYCALPVLVRGFYAMGDRATPLRIALGAVALNLTLDLSLIWWLAETGLAAATVVSASSQMVVLAVLFSRRHVRLGWAKLAATMARAAIASVAMALAGMLLLRTTSNVDGTWNPAIQLACPLFGCLSVYAFMIGTFGRSDWVELLSRGPISQPSN
jgi:putative peptidoglycan lipid II flippase